MFVDEKVPDTLLEVVFGPEGAVIPMPYHDPCVNCSVDTNDRKYFKHPKCNKTICARCIHKDGKPKCPHCGESMIMPRS